MIEIGIVLLIVALAVFYLTRRYMGTIRQTQQSKGGCGGGCGCSDSAVASDTEGCGIGPSPNNTLK